MKNTMRITTDKYQEVLKHEIENFGKVLVSGAPGIGKSVMLEKMQLMAKHEDDETVDMRKKLGKDWVIIEERIYNRGEFAAGIPSVVKDEKTGLETTIWTAPTWLVNIKKAQMEGKKVCILFDDFHLLVEELQKPLYEFFESYTLNGYSVDPCAIVILGNYSVETLNMRAEIESPIMGRLTAFYELVPDFKDWVMNVSDIHPKLAHFFAQNPDKFYTPDPENTTMYTSPRTISTASKVLNQGHPLGVSVLKSILGMEVGAEIEAEWEHLGLTLEEMLTPDKNPIKNSVKTLMLAKTANINEKTDEYFFNIMKRADKVFSEELCFNIFLTCARKFKYSGNKEEKAWYDKNLFKVMIELSKAKRSGSKPKKPSHMSKEDFALSIKYIEFMQKFSSNNVSKK